MAGWFELAKASDGQFKFVLKAGNGEIILVSELYNAHAGAANGIAPVQKNAADPAGYEVKVASNGKHHFNLKRPTIRSSAAASCMPVKPVAVPASPRYRPMAPVLRSRT